MIVQKVRSFGGGLRSPSALVMIALISNIGVVGPLCLYKLFNRAYLQSNLLW